MNLPEWLPLAVGIVFFAAALILTILEQLGIIELPEEEPKEETCRFCGSTPVCDICGRCYDSRCNAGCVFCRDYSQQQPRTCSCCGQELWR
ncbi:MAG: hypothetical protein GWN58_26325 [Anaerolineae bacterium]|nr:hypothetical protein [Anaerolineae bacterium]